MHERTSMSSVVDVCQVGTAGAGPLKCHQPWNIKHKHTHACMQKHSEMHTHMYKYSLKFLNQSVSLHMARPWMQQHWHQTAAFGMSATSCPEYNCTGSMWRTGSQSVLTFTLLLFFAGKTPKLSHYSTEPPALIK